VEGDLRQGAARARVAAEGKGMGQGWRGSLEHCMAMADEGEGGDEAKERERRP
jgi:hypothetical protein